MIRRMCQALPRILVTSMRPTSQTMTRTSASPAAARPSRASAVQSEIWRAGSGRFEEHQIEDDQQTTGARDRQHSRTEAREQALHL